MVLLDLSKPKGLYIGGKVVQTYGPDLICKSCIDGQTRKPRRQVVVQLAGDAEPLGFGVAGGAFRLPLRGELSFQVVEEGFPVHPTERRGGRRLLRVIHIPAETALLPARAAVVYGLSTDLGRWRPCRTGNVFY